MTTVMDWMFVSSQNSCVETLNPNMIALGDQTLEVLIRFRPGSLGCGPHDGSSALTRKGIDRNAHSLSTFMHQKGKQTNKQKTYEHMVRR